MKDVVIQIYKELSRSGDIVNAKKCRKEAVKKSIKHHIFAHALFTRCACCGADYLICIKHFVKMCASDSNILIFYGRFIIRQWS